MKKMPALGLALILLGFPTLFAATNDFKFSLKDEKAFEEAFLDTWDDPDLKQLDGGPVLPSGSRFQINPETGLELVSDTAKLSRGAYLWKNLLPLEADWRVEVLGHVTEFDAQGLDPASNPFFHVGMNLYFVGNSTSSPGDVFANRFNLLLTRSSGGTPPVTLANRIFQGNYTSNNGDTVAMTGPLSADLKLRIDYSSSNRTFTTSYSTDNSSYSAIQSYSISEWDSAVTDLSSVGMTLSALSDPFNGSNRSTNPNFKVSPGTLYLRDLSISVNSTKSLESWQVESSPTPAPPAAVAPSGGGNEPSAPFEESKKKRGHGKKSKFKKNGSSVENSGFKKKPDGKKKKKKNRDSA